MNYFILFYPLLQFRMHLKKSVGVCVFSACDHMPGKVPEFRDTPRFWWKGHHSFPGIIFEVAGSRCRA